MCLSTFTKQPHEKKDPSDVCAVTPKVISHSKNGKNDPKTTSFQILTKRGEKRRKRNTTKSILRHQNFCQINP
jgi:hypothetical protein